MQSFVPGVRSFPIQAALFVGFTAFVGCKNAPANTRDIVSHEASVQPQVVQDAGAVNEHDRWSEASMLHEADRYIDDRAFRRGVVERTFENPDNLYSKVRINNYGLEERGWEKLPEWNPRSIPATREHGERLTRGEKLVLPPETKPLYSGVRPRTMQEWVALGREAFFGYPLRREIYADYALTRPQVAERAGVQIAPDGSYPGIRVFADVDGSTGLAITCAVCHTNVRSVALGPPRLIVGEARRSFDYGALRIAYHEETKAPVDANLVRRMKTWGPGRADVSEDDDEDPVAIPDLWGLKTQTFLTQGGTIKHLGPTSLAIRQETQLLHSNHQKIRPPREVAYALAMFLYSLKPDNPVRPDAHKMGIDLRSAQRQELLPKGTKLFEKECSSCHSNAVWGGPLVDADRVGTDPMLAKGAARGTGKYRPPSLLNVRFAAPFFHDGSVRGFEELFSRERLKDNYGVGLLGKGAIKGHRYGTSLSAAEKDALVAYLETL